MGKIKDKLIEIRKNLGLSQADFAKAIGVGARTYSRYEQEERPIPSDVLLNIARLGKVPVDWILNEETTVQNETMEANEITIPLYGAGAGEGIYNYESRRFLLSLNPDMFPWANEKNVSAIEVDGDSMEPALRNGDYIIVTPVDPSRRTEDGIYALRIGGAVKIKALQFMLDGKIKIISYNDKYETEIYDPEVSQVDFEIIGKMRLRITK